MLKSRIWTYSKCNILDTPTFPLKLKVEASDQIICRIGQKMTTLANFTLIEPKKNEWWAKLCDLGASNRKTDPQNQNLCENGVRKCHVQRKMVAGVAWTTAAGDDQRRSMVEPSDGWRRVAWSLVKALIPC